MNLRSYPRIYFVLLASGFAFFFGMSLSSAFLPIFAKKLDSSGLLVGLVTSAWFISRIFIELPSGILINHLGRHNILASGLALSALGALLCSFANTIYILIVGRTLWGLGAGLFFISSSSTIFALFKLKNRGRALGIFQAITFTGSFIGVPVGSFLSLFIQYNGVFQIAFTTIFCSLIITLLSKEMWKIDELNVRKGLSVKKVLSRLKSWELTAIYTTSFTRMFIMVGLTGTIFPLYLNLELGISIGIIGVIISLRTLGAIASTMFSGILSDKYGGKIIVIFGMLIQIICFCAYIIITIPEALLLIGLIEGLGRGMVLTSIMVIVSAAVSPKVREGAIGMYRTFMNLGGFAGPLVFMYILENLGSYSAFLSAIIILSTNVILTKKIQKPRQDEDTDS